MQGLERHLFDEEAATYAVLDGASMPRLPVQLARLRPEHVCLYRGELTPDLAECAPYLVRLQPAHGFTSWVLQNGWGAHWGIFAKTSTDIEVLRRHLRRLLRVKLPDGKQVMFRFYDPRVLGVYLPTCNEDELRFIFGPIRQLLCEDDPPSRLRSWAASDPAPAAGIVLEL